MNEDGKEPNTTGSSRPGRFSGLSSLQQEYAIAQMWKTAVDGAPVDSDRPTRVLTASDFERHNWDLQPLSKPMPIPPPDRVWTSAELARIACGYMASMMEEKWHALVDDGCLRFHRSWTGYGIYEATFEPCEGGAVIVGARVEGNPERYSRYDDVTESQMLEFLIDNWLLGLPGRWPDLWTSGTDDARLSRQQTEADTEVWQLAKVEVTFGDIADERADAVICPTSPAMTGSGGASRAIHRAAGPRLREHLKELGGCEPGQAIATPGFDMAVPWIIHTVGPRWRGGAHNEAHVLASCYRESLARADEVGASVVATPAVATGQYGYPMRAAAGTAVGVLGFTPTHVDTARIVCYSVPSLKAHRAALAQKNE